MLIPDSKDQVKNRGGRNAHLGHGSAGIGQQKGKVTQWGWRPVKSTRPVSTTFSALGCTPWNARGFSAATFSLPSSPAKKS